MAAAQLEGILGNLLVPDNAVIQQATRDLQVVYKDPAIVQPLCDILCSSQNAQMRQYSAVLLRKKLVKTWKKIPQELQLRIKATLLQCLSQEKQHLVLRSVAHTVSVIAKHEYSQGQWGELNQFIIQHCNSPDPGLRETGLLLLSSLMDTAASQFQPQFPQLLQLFSAALDDSGSKMVPFYALKLLQPWFQSPDQFHRGAALVAVAVVTEGCSEYIRNNHLKSLLQIVYKGVTDERRNVRNSALFAIGQFAEHLQPEIGQYHSELMPVLFQFMDNAILAEQQQLPGNKRTGLTKIFYAIETFGTQLGEGLLPYLDQLMEKLFLILSVTNNIHVQELVVSGFSAAAEACEGKILPYFPRIIEVLRQIIAAPFNQEKAILQAHAIDALGTLARTIGHEHFRHLSLECVELGQNLMQSNDPDLRRSVYGMFASVSGVLKEEMVPHLQPIISRMIESLTSEEGVTVHNASFQVAFLNFEEEDEEGEGDETGGGGNMGSIEDDDAVEGTMWETPTLRRKTLIMQCTG